MNRNKNGKRKVILAVAVAILAILLFWLLLKFVFDRTELGSQFGDTGGFGDDAGPIELEFDEDTYETEDNIDTYLLIGTDAGGEDFGEGFNGELADFLVLLVVDNTTEKFGFYTIDRNTMTEMDIVDENGDFEEYPAQQLCLAHWYGTNDNIRNSNTVSAVSHVLGGLEIDNYYTVMMDDIGKFNDAIGGVQVDIETDMTKVDPEFVKGTSVLLKGDQAEDFILLYKRLESGKYQWPRNEDELKPISWTQFRWLMEGFQVEQRSFIKPAPKGRFL